MIIMMIFNMSTWYFHKISFYCFEDDLMTKLTLGLSGSVDQPLDDLAKFCNELNTKVQNFQHPWILFLATFVNLL